MPTRYQFFWMAILALSTLATLPGYAQSPQPEQMFNPVIQAFQLWPDFEVSATDPRFQQSLHVTKGVLGFLLGSENSEFLQSMLTTEIKTVSKQGSQLQINYPTEKRIDVAQIPTEWKARLDHALSQASLPTTVQSINRAERLTVATQSDPVGISLEGLTLELQVMGLIGGKTETIAARLVRQGSVLGMDIGVGYQAGVFVGEQPITFIPLTRQE